MTEQPTALRLADAMSLSFPGNLGIDKAAAELRRLSEIETLYLAAMRGRHAMSEELLALTAQRDALLGALKELTGHTNKRFTGGVWDRARAAIKQAEGENT